jgi:hypothetical protein
MMTNSTHSTRYDMRHVEALVYHFADKPDVEVEMPATVAVAETGEHLITDVAGVGVIVPPGWMRIEVYPLPDRTPFNDA